MTEMAEELGAHRAKEFNVGVNPNKLGGCLHTAGSQQWFCSRGWLQDVACKLHISCFMCYSRS